MNVKFSSEVNAIEDNPFKTAKVKQMHFLPFVGVEKGSYGGRANTIAELQDGKTFLVVDSSLNTIAVGKKQFFQKKDA